MKKNEYDELKYYYSDFTLTQLIFIRFNFGKTWKINSSLKNAFLAFALGLMHGPSRKNGDTIYFSVSMPNTISMSPNYVKKYVEKYKLIKPDVNVFEKIIDRIEKNLIH